MKQAGLSACLILVSLLLVILACTFGSTNMPINRVLAASFGQGDAGDQLVIWSIRLPRALTAWLVGAALALSGAALQGLLRNPLAEPGVLGVSSGASLGATLSIYYGIAALTPWILPLSAIAMALLATLLIAIASTRTQSIVTLILVGVGLSSFFGAAMSFLMNMAPTPFTLSDMINWMLGSVANRSFTDLAFSGPFILLGCGILLFSGRSLSALTLGEEAASALGVHLKRNRLLIVLGTGLAAGGAVALAGAIGFVGIVVPHLIRPFVRHDPARTLLPSALAGGALLVLADIGVRVLPTLNELKLGVVAALFGAPAFIWIALRQRHSDA